MKTEYSKLIVAILFALISLGAIGAPARAAACEANQSQQCACPNGSTGAQSCAADGAGWQACNCLWYDAWYDEETDLSWQDPQKDAYTADNVGVTSFDAIRYCEELVIRGHDDWRLPTIDELRTLIRGAPQSQGRRRLRGHRGREAGRRIDPGHHDLRRATPAVPVCGRRPMLLERGADRDLQHGGPGQHDPLPGVLEFDPGRGRSGQLDRLRFFRHGHGRFQPLAFLR